MKSWNCSHEPFFLGSERLSYQDFVKSLEESQRLRSSHVFEDDKLMGARGRGTPHETCFHGEQIPDTPIPIAMHVLYKRDKKVLW